MAHENQSMRLTGSIYAFRIVEGVEQTGLGPLNGDVLSFQSAAEIVKVADKRKNRRGQNMKVFTDPSAPTGTLNLYSVPPKLLAMLMLGGIVARNDAAGSVTEGLSLVDDEWTPLSQANVSSVTLVDGVRADLDTGVVGSNNAITWTAIKAGTGGNSITVALVNTGINNAPLAITVTGTAISVSCATNGSAAITSTAAEVIAAVNADSAAALLLSAANTSTSTGAAAVAAAASAPLASGANTGGTTYTLDEDYEIDAHLGLLRPIAGSALAGVTTAVAAYSHGQITGDRIEVGTDYTVRARLLLTGTNDSDGTAIEWEAYSALLTPNGEFDLLSAEPVQAQFSVEFETPDGKDHAIRLDFPTYA